MPSQSSAGTPCSEAKLGAGGSRPDVQAQLSCARRAQALAVVAAMPNRSLTTIGGSSVTAVIMALLCAIAGRIAPCAAHGGAASWSAGWVPSYEVAGSCVGDIRRRVESGTIGREV